MTSDQAARRKWLELPWAAIANAGGMGMGLAAVMGVAFVGATAVATSVAPTVPAARRSHRGQEIDVAQCTALIAPYGPTVLLGCKLSE